MSGKHEKKKHRFSKGVVVLVLALNIAFTVAVMAVNLLGHDVPDSLIYSWFQFVCVELVSLMGGTITQTIMEARGTSVGEQVGKPISAFTTWVTEHFGGTGKSTDNESKGPATISKATESEESEDDAEG